MSGRSLRKASLSTLYACLQANGHYIIVAAIERARFDHAFPQTNCLLTLLALDNIQDCLVAHRQGFVCFSFFLMGASARVYDLARVAGRRSNYPSEPRVPEDG